MPESEPVVPFTKPKPPSWRSKSDVTMGYARRPARALALLAFVGIASVMALSFARHKTAPPPPPPIAKIGQVQADSATSAVTVTAPPTGTTAGNTLVAQVLASGGSAITAPDGWTLIGTSSDGTNVAQAVFTAPGLLGGPYQWNSTGATAMEAVVSAWSNSTKVSAMSTSSSTADSATATAPATGTLPSGSKVLSFFASNAGPLPYANSGTLLGVSPNGAGNTSGTDAGVKSFEQTIGRQVAFNHHYLGFDFSSLFPSNSSTSNLAVQMNADMAAGRMSYLTFGHSTLNSIDSGGWPTPTGNGGANSLNVGLQQIAAGQYDSVIIANAQAMKNWRQPLIFRMWHEMNQNMPWSALQSPCGWTNAQYTTYFLDAWKRVYSLTRGTDAQLSALSPAAPSSLSGHSVGATNVLFHWNPGYLDSSRQCTGNTTKVAASTLYPGDAFVQFAGSEWYSQPGKATPTLATILGAANTTYGQSSTHHGKILGLGSGEGAARLCVQSGCTNETNSQSDYFSGALATLKGGTFNDWKFLLYWDSLGPVGDNELETHSTGPESTAVAGFKTWVLDPIMNPVLNNTWLAPVTGWTTEYQLRRATGAANTNYGDGSLGAMALSQTLSTSKSVPAVSASSAGFGRWATLSFALEQ